MIINTAALRVHTLVSHRNFIVYKKSCAISEVLNEVHRRTGIP